MPASTRPGSSPLPRIIAVLGGVLLLAILGMVMVRGTAFGPTHMVGATVAFALLLVPAWSTAPPLAPASCILLGTWFGLLTGIAEVVHRQFKYGSMFKNIPQDFVWIAPLTYVCFFVGLAAIPACMSRLGFRLVSLPALVLPFTIFAIWSQTILYPIYRVAEVALCAGLGVQAARVAAANSERLVAVTRRMIPWLLLVVAAFTGALLWSRCEDQALDRLPPPRDQAPNVLLIVLDTVRADHLQPYGYDRETTPTIAALARDGVTFDWAFSTSPWTLPSHVSMFTGLYPHEFDADWTIPFGDGPATIGEALSERGYATAGFIANLGYMTWGQGVDRGFTRYEDFYLDHRMVTISTNFGKQIANRLFGGGGTHDYMRNSAGTVTDQFLSWLEKPRERPFFAFLNYFDAHAHYHAPPGYDDRWLPKSDIIRRWYATVNPSTVDPDGPRTWNQAWPREELPGFINAYDGCIRYIDDQLARIVDDLRSRSLLSNTVIIITSDHGEQFGEHNLVDHSNSLYLPLLHVPLVVSWPERMPRGARVDQPVSLRDLAATILDLTGPGTQSPLPGSSLAPLWDAGRGEAPVTVSPCLAEVSAAINREPWLPISRGAMTTLFQGNMHYIRNGDGVEELYDFLSDRGEERDLSNDAAHRETRARMSATVDQLLKAK